MSDGHSLFEQHVYCELCSGYEIFMIGYCGNVRWPFLEDFITMHMYVSDDTFSLVGCSTV